MTGPSAPVAMRDLPRQRDLTAEERAWVETSVVALLRQQPPATAHVGFDDAPDGLLAVLRRERP